MTKDLVKTRLEQYYAAEKAVLTGQSYKIGNKALTRANLAEIQKMIGELEKTLVALETGANPYAPRVKRVVPLDI